MKPIERVEHIRQCLRGMRPTMGYELHAAEAIEKDLQALKQYIWEQDRGASEDKDAEPLNAPCPE